ncbi:mariner transposase [Trichonephila clavipes]|nr:mariner transposase [Trichonephila clavipes]
MIMSFYLLTPNKIKPFLDREITEDEKWITYENFVKKKTYYEPGKLAPSIFKPKLCLSKRMLSIWRRIRGPIHFELLKPKEKLNPERYTRYFGDGPRNFEPWSSDDDNT